MSVEMNAPTMKRPAGVSVVAVLIVIAALFNITVGLVLIFSSFGENPSVTNFMTGQATTVSTLYLWVNGLLMVFLAFIYFWLARLTLVGSATAHMLISLLAVINIFFGFFQLAYGGWGQILVNLIILLLINTQKAKSWFVQNV